jgi:hypothetical protein
MQPKKTKQEVKQQKMKDKKDEKDTQLTKTAQTLVGKGNKKQTLKEVVEQINLISHQPSYDG